jgi:hypothetical protein
MITDFAGGSRSGLAPHSALEVMTALRSSHVASAPHRR